ncbi:DUF3199 family protein [Bacillus licheniformis]|uniref:protein YqbG n=1 Tax=Bacillus TaxID=1386 RepID=UPI00227E6059|nr:MULTISPECIES: DUF3199 family protein [Bacillus]MCY8341141.1 DUF3199 family protein [Bacillus haynesii]MCY8384825.1 DUF3199 family protein [Bacillus haynesii]MCY9349873.1 DUF3199 family protein [Bacillus licheniformis]
MLITPEEVIAYSVFEAVKSRPENLLQHDILEAETEIHSIVGHNFSDEKYQPLPEKVKLALLKMAQYFALINSDESIVKGYKSEKIGDYSYTLGDGQTIQKPDVENLLKDFVEDPNDPPDGKGSVLLRVRAL